MNAPPLPARGNECPPAIALEDLAASGAALPPHVAGCEACRGYVGALQQELAAYRKARPFEQLETKLALRASSRPALSRFRWLFAVLPLAAAAAVLFVLLGRPSPQPSIRDMGSRFTVTARRASTQVVEPLRDGSSVGVGDRLGFTVDTPAAGQLLVLELDGKDEVSTVYSGPVAAGSTVLPKSWELTAPAAPEWFVAVFDTTPLDAGALTAQLKGQATRASLELHCGDCRWFTVRLTTPH